MNGFVQLRLWMRQGPSAEKRLVVFALVVLAGLAAWAVVPVGPDATGTTVTAVGPGFGSAPASASASTPTGAPTVATTATATGATTPGAAPPGGGSAAAPGAAPGDATSEPASGSAGPACPGTPADVPGVSDGEIRVAVTLFNVFGANREIDVPTAEEQRGIWEAMFDSVNQAGGVACRAVVGNFYEMNPLDQSSQRSGCLRIVEDGNFALVGAGGFFPQNEALCLPQNGVPMFGFYGLLASTQQQFHPYVFSVGARTDTAMRTWVLGARDAGFFDGVGKLGVFANNCDPEVNDALMAGLAEIGITGDQISRFAGDCPIGGQTPPNQCMQAALQHKLDGVTHVLLNAGQSPNNCYVNGAARQGFRPRYSTSDYVLGIAPPTLGEGPDAAAFDGALGITLSRMGHFSAGLPADPGTVQCNDWLTSHGLEPIGADSAPNLVRGTACSSFQLFLAAVTHAPSLARTDLAAGLAQAGPVPFSWPGADGLFDRPDKVTGGDFYRVVQWQRSCGCWNVVDPAFRPSVAAS